MLLISSLCCGDGAPAEDSEAAAAPTAPGNTLLVLLDKTLSLPNDSVQLKFETVVRGRVVDLIKDHEDRAVLHYVHGNTIGAQAAVDKVLDVPPLSPAELEALGKRSQKAKQDERVAKIKQQQYAAINAIETAFLTPNDEATNRQTDLWATLEIMSRVFDQADVANRKHVIFVSDMEESMRGAERRDFTRAVPEDRAQALAWAEADLAAIERDYQLRPEALRGARVTIYLPRTALESSRFQTIRYYWEALFGRLDAEIVEVRGIEIG